MCILVIKPQGQSFPSVANISNCCDNNPDGFSLSYSYKGALSTYKTMSKKDFIKYYKQLIKLPKDEVAMILHCRIKTHGSCKIENCHCWEGEGLSFAHNGILSIKNRGDMTDSETFFRDIFSPIYHATHDWSVAENAINAVIGTSKFGFLAPNGEIHHYGMFTDEKGVLYSNSSYQKRTYPVYTYPAYYGKGIGYKYGNSVQSKPKTQSQSQFPKTIWEDWDDLDW